MKQWGTTCHVSCLAATNSHFRVLEGHAMNEPASAHSHYPDLSKVIPCYHYIKEVFNKAKATSLRPHSEWDSAIDLLPGAPISKARLYAISSPERKAMDEYIEALLRSGIIRPSSSVAGPGFFFVGKKDNSRHAYDITVKNRYLLLLISSAFELLQQARVFTRLDLRNAYHLVRIWEGDEWKMGFNTPSGHYEYLTTYSSSLLIQQLINVTSVTSDLLAGEPAIRQGGEILFSQWSPKAEEAFQRLKKLFTTASILMVLDPTLQFVVEVDALNKCIGAVLSQRSAVDNRIHPYAFLSCRCPRRPNLMLCPTCMNWEPSAKEPETILPPDRVVGSVTWQIEKDVQRVCCGESQLLRGVLETDCSYRKCGSPSLVFPQSRLVSSLV
ncbi:hypothetical protein L3Q82_022336 [Scortum barcoo]|uniref:Uncharacterized protein n=1 Tax=Scortum barcoo TaxID=214431 RepID=A0ACB8X187_9TELE|nr:hypothetical protein L3Q82_022336 [Scortum barcoo]